nr:hypothetical protein [Tanacetum cinerariifolium]
VMAILVISVSSDSSEDKVGTPVGRVFLFGTIPTTILDTTPVITPPTTQTDTTRSSVTPRRQVMILAPGQSIPHGRPYRYHPNRPIHMMTSRKRVGPLPVQQLAVRHFIDHSSSDSSSRHSLSDHSSHDLPSTSAGPSCKIRRSPMTSIPALLPVSEALSSFHADLIPSPKRVRDIGYSANVEFGPRETRVEMVTHPAMPEDIPEPTQEGAVQREQGHRIVGVKSAVTALTERVAELERDSRRLRGTVSVESQRVDQLQHGMSHDQEGKNGGNEGNGNGDNGGNRRNGNGGNGGNRNHGMNYRGFMLMAPEFPF